MFLIQTEKSDGVVNATSTTVLISLYFFLNTIKIIIVEKAAIIVNKCLTFEGFEFRILARLKITTTLYTQGYMPSPSTLFLYYNASIVPDLYSASISPRFFYQWAASKSVD